MVALPLACGGGVGNGALPSGPIAAGNVAAVPVDTLVNVNGENAVLGRDAGGLYAMSAVCTHMGCILMAFSGTTARLDCGCHGSRFDRYGAVTRGPAGSPLIHYRVDVAADGSITIQGGMVVASTDRTVVA